MTGAPGWHADPHGRFEQRYWDGRTWTDHVATRGVQGVDGPRSGPVPSHSVGPTQGAAARWAADPFGRFDLRYWDGARWTDRVATSGWQTIDPPVVGAASGRPSPPPRPHQAWMAAQPAPASLFDARVLVVNQKAKLFERSAEYSVFDADGGRLGAVREVDRSVLRRATGMGSTHGTHRFQVLDQHGRVVISLLSPSRAFKSRMVVTGSHGATGEIVQKTVGVFKGVRFALVANGRELGSIVADGRHEWDFAILDAAGLEVARITKTWAGWAKERFTKADNYVVQIHRDLPDPLRTLVVASALAIDTALKQGEPTSGKGRNRRYR